MKTVDIFELVQSENITTVFFQTITVHDSLGCALAGRKWQEMDDEALSPLQQHWESAEKFVFINTKPFDTSARSIYHPQTRPITIRGKTVGWERRRNASMLTWAHCAVVLHIAFSGPKPHSDQIGCFNINTTPWNQHDSLA